MNCYGRQYGRLGKCQACELAEYCRDAGDPSALTGPHAGPEGNDAAFEAALATFAGEEDASNAAEPDMGGAELGEVLATVCDACEYVPDRIAGVVLRLMGLSLGQIGALTGKSRQAVHKDVGKIEQADPRIGALARQRFALRSERVAELCEVLQAVSRSNGRKPWDARALLNAALAEDFRRRRAKNPGMPLTGEGGMYAELARYWGLSSWVAAECRIRHFGKTVHFCRKSGRLTPETLA